MAESERSREAAEQEYGKGPTYYSDPDECARAIVDRMGKRVIFAMPLALGKPIRLVNALYRLAKADPALQYSIVTALHLEPPPISSELERRFLEPYFKREWGNIPVFEYMHDMRANKLPPNVDVSEFFLRAGSGRGVPHIQQHFMCSNYTHCPRDGSDAGCNVLSQVVAERTVDGGKLYSMSCNPDTHHQAGREEWDRRRKLKTTSHSPQLITCEVNRNLPFMWGHSCVPPGWYDIVLDDPNYSVPLFAAPKEAVSIVDYMIGLQASALVADGGTLQIGIGSLGDAVVYGLQMRQLHNQSYRQALANVGVLRRHSDLIARIGGLDPFDKGLLGSSEMFVDGFMHLIQAGVVKRKVYEHEGLQRLLNEGKVQEKFGRNILEVLVKEDVIHPHLREEEFDALQQFGVLNDSVSYRDEKILCGTEVLSNNLADPANLEKLKAKCLGAELRDGVFLYGGFFLGPNDFYQYLRDLPEDLRRGIRMEGVDFVNQLYGGEGLRREQRVKGRFINAGLMATVAGAFVSDGIENNSPISGPGGQYNFVAMAHALADARSIMTFRSWRMDGKVPVSNIVWQYGNTTIPRHLRDIMITEYGIADVRGKRDKDVITAMIQIADSRFQNELIDNAKQHLKIPSDYVLPDQYRYNFPERIEEEMKPYKAKGLFPAFPYGSTLTPDEIVLGAALKTLKEKMVTDRTSAMKALARSAMMSVPDAAKPHLERMGLDSPKDTHEKVLQKTVLAGLLLTEAI